MKEAGVDDPRRVASRYPKEKMHCPLPVPRCPYTLFANRPLIVPAISKSRPRPYRTPGNRRYTQRDHGQLVTSARMPDPSLFQTSHLFHIGAYKVSAEHTIEVVLGIIRCLGMEFDEKVP